MENMIEGKVTLGQKVVVVEDLVSTGGSSLKAVADLRAAGFEVLGMVAILLTDLISPKRILKRRELSLFV
jgi:orotate phosphoribosyltransferase